jgi:hypothetical protein
MNLNSWIGRANGTLCRFWQYAYSDENSKQRETLEAGEYNSLAAYFITRRRKASNRKRQSDWATKAVSLVSMKKIILRNSKGEEVAAILSDEESHRWRIVSKAEPTFQRTFATEKEAFDVWHANFNAQTGRLRK